MKVTLLYDCFSRFYIVQMAPSRAKRLMIGILLFFLFNPFIPRASLSIYVEKELWFRDSEFKRKDNICRMDSITDQNVKTGLGIGKDFIAYCIF